MKLNKLYLLLVLIMGAFAFAACGDDEPDPEPQDKGTVSEAIREVVGIYIGQTHLKTNFIDKTYKDDTLSLAISDGGTLIATFKNKTWGTATITGITASRIVNDQGYKLEHGAGSFVMNNPRDNTTEEFSCWLDYALISADKKQMKAIIIANMTTTGAHGEMTFVFQTDEKLTPAS